MPHDWENIYDVDDHTYHCGACGERTTGRFGIRQLSREHNRFARARATVVICSHCGSPTYFERFKQVYPKPRYRQNVEGITDSGVLDLYREARYCTSYEAFTSAAMLCRKILMHVAVSLGAKPNQNFKEYVDYLDREGYTPAKGKGWVDDIRDKGNEANHEIRIVSEEEAKKTLYFTGLILQLVYSAPHYLKKT
jgi:hypothetical protein